MKRIRFGIMTLLAFASANVSAKEIPIITSQVTDLAELIPETTEINLRKEIIAFEKSSGHQLAVITVKDLQDRPYEELSLDIARQWSGGDKGADDGILLFFYPGDGSPGSGKIRIEVGYGMEYILTDFATSRIVNDTIIPVLKEDRPRSESTPDAIVAGTKELIRLGAITPEQKAEFDAKEKAAYEKAERESREAFLGFLSVVGTLLGIGLIIFGIYRFATRKERARKKEEERLQAIEAAKERARIVKESREREEKERKRRIKEREDMLNAMSPTQRANFLAVEKEKARQAAIRAQQQMAIWEAERLARQQADEARRQRQENESGSYDSGSVFGGFGSGSSGSSSDDSYSGGRGGGFGGGGSGGSF